MRESAQAALSYARAHAKEFDIDPRMFSHYDLHIHVPGGGNPKRWSFCRSHPSFINYLHLLDEQLMQNMQ